MTGTRRFLLFPPLTCGQRKAPFVPQYCDEERIEAATLSGAEHRCPFLLNILDAFDIIDAKGDEIRVKEIVLTTMLVRPHRREAEADSRKRLRKLAEAWPSSPEVLSSEDSSILSELFGPEFLTEPYYLKKLTILEDL